MSKQVCFDVTRDDARIIGKIVDRASSICAENGFKFDGMSCHMDMCAVHANGNPMDFERLFAADNFNFTHDVFGIARHLNRETGKLGDHFSPRFSLK